LKEKNVLLSEKEWCRANRKHWTGGGPKMWKVKSSMARIKTVLGERTRAYDLAEKRIEEEKLKLMEASERASEQE